jgi:hypothetical protein
MSEEEQLIKVFYTCFQHRDWKGMLDCYREDVFFYDPVFENLEGPQVRAMWEMLLTSAKDLEMSFSNIQSEPASADSISAEPASPQDSYGSCQWIATYTFSQTGRRVVNKGHASFKFSGGKIAEHQDQFSLWRWSRQALGIPGILFGWTPVLQNKIRQSAWKNLGKFMARSSPKKN